MSGTYHLVHFVPDPFSGARFPIAALVQSSAGVQVALAEHTPGPDCLGGSQSAHLLEALRDELETARDVLDLRRASPHLFVANALSLPASVQNPVEWLRRHILPRHAPNQTVERPRRMSVHEMGYGFLVTHQVDKFVRRRFQPTKHAPRLFGDETSRLLLPSVPHWVEGAGELLLLQPVAPGRPTVRADLTRLNEIFSSYVLARERFEAEVRVRCWAYVLDTGREDQREEVVERLRTSAVDDVLDTAVRGARTRLIDEIRLVGETTPLESRSAH